MADGAVGGGLGMHAVDGKVGLLEMLEILRIEDHEFGIASRVFLVAHRTLVCNLPVHTLLSRDPLGDGLMADEAFSGGKGLVGLVARETALFGIEVRMCSTEGAGRAQLRRLLRPGRERPTEAGHRSYHDKENELQSSHQRTHTRSKTSAELRSINDASGSVVRNSAIFKQFLN